MLYLGVSKLMSVSELGLRETTNRKSVQLAMGNLKWDPVGTTGGVASI